MTGNELATAVQAVHGPISVPVSLWSFNVYVYAVKSDLIKVLKAEGDLETGYCLGLEDRGYFLRAIN